MLLGCYTNNVSRRSAGLFLTLRLVTAARNDCYVKPTIVGQIKCGSLFTKPISEIGIYMNHHPNFDTRRRILGSPSTNRLFTPTGLGLPKKD